MTTRIVRVGNTLTVEIPEELVAQAALPAGEPVEWVRERERQHCACEAVVSLREAPQRMTLDEILAGIPEDAEMEKIDWGPDRGAEIW